MTAPERELLAALAFEPAEAVPILESLNFRPAWFSDDRDRRIARAILALGEAALTPSVLAQETGLSVDEARDFIVGLDAVGGSYLAAVPHLVAQVREGHQKRRLAKVAQDLAKATENGRPSSEAMAEALIGIESVRDDGSAVPRPVTLAEALAEPRAEVAAVVGEAGNVLLPRGGVALLAGEPGFGKSTLMVQVGLELAAGRRPFGWPTAGRPVRVLYAASEGSRNALLDRIGSASAALGLVPDESLPFHVLAATGALPKLGPTEGGLLSAVRTVGAELVILDTFGPFCPSLASENDAANVKAALFGPLDDLCRATGCAAVLVHHLAKRSELRTDRDRIRGSSAFVGEPDLVWRLDLPAGGSAREDTRLVYADKVRHGREHEPLALVLDRDRGIFELSEADGLSLAMPRLADLATLCRQVGKARTAELVEAMRQRYGVSHRQAKRLVDQARLAGLIERTERGVYVAAGPALGFDPDDDPEATN